MNILFVTSWYPSKLDPTNGNFVERHALALISQGHHVRIVHEGFSHRILFPTLGTETVAGLEIFHLYLPRSLKGQMAVRNAIARRLLRRLKISGVGVDIVHGNVLYPVGPLAVFLAESLKVPLVFTEHWSGFLPINSTKLAPGLIFNIQSVVSKCSCMMPVSENLKSAMQKLGFQGNYEVVYNSVDTDIFYPIDRKIKNHFRFLHISTFAETKNVNGIIRAFATFHSANPKMNVDFTIAGDGDVDALKSFTQKEFPGMRNIHFLGTQTYEGVARLMQDSDCFILFSNYENLPCVIAEAHCCGLPVISTGVGGIPEMVDSSNGILIPPQDEVALTRAMTSVVQNRWKYQSIDIHEKAKSKYAYQVIGKQFEQIYLSAIQTRAPESNR